MFYASWVFVGIVCSVVAHLWGLRDSSWAAVLVVGIVGAIIGGLIGWGLWGGPPPHGVSIGALVVAGIISILVLFAYRLALVRRNATQ